MIDINQLRQDPEKFKTACQAKNVEPKLVDQLLQSDKERRELLGKVEQLRAQHNEITAKLKTNQDKSLISQATTLKDELKALEPRLAKDEKDFIELLQQIPNPPAEDVAIAKDESANQVIKTWGEKPNFKFKPKDHLELGEALDLIDVKRAAKVSGTRFGYWKNEAVLLEMALIQLGFTNLLKQGFVPVIPPVMIKSKAMQAMGYLEHGGQAESYFLEADDLYLVGTSEQSIGPMHGDELFNENDLPKRYIAFSTCFRREAGSYGKDTRGLLRVHQFNKMEMFVFIRPQNSDQEHEWLLALEEKLVQSLNLPYQVIKMCSGDLGLPAARKYDIECWLPSQNKYRETHSASSCTDFQARRLNIKYRQKNNATDFVHTLNGTYFAERLLIAILENYQQADGSIQVPKILQAYVDKETIT
ncbi:serine--tRNA ligase [Patescibacteria group bacterium]|nr:serine--tRNA ligase [Patescibacteria group bacterium]MBU1931480.1 serine--tRNA ligase [Patescibacteria group bacterium]